MSCSSVWIWTVVVVVAMLVSVNEAADFHLGKYGAKADGKSDDSQAIMKAWKDACESTTASKIVIPKGTYMVGPLNFRGPCKGAVSVQAIGATFLAPVDSNRLKSQNGWVIFQSLNNFRLSGGTFDGQGHTAWKQNNWKAEGCLKGGKCPAIPINMNFHDINNSVITDMTSKDSKNFHINCVASSNVTFSKVTIDAPEDSPNTDGIHLAHGVNIKILDTTIKTGDDCVSMGEDLKEVLIKNVKCGPGHGISIGSLGKNAKEKDVTGVTVESCTFTGTSNGVRVKTWPSAPGTMKITDLKFIDLTMVNASNPVIFDQQYCPWNHCNLEKPSLIQISKVQIANIKGSSGTQDVLVFSCSAAKPCQDVQIGNVDLTFTGDPNLGGPTTRCENIKYKSTGKQNPPLCVKSSAATPPPPGQKAKSSSR